MQDSQAFLELFSDADTLRYWPREPISELSEAQFLVREKLDWAGSGEGVIWGIALPNSNLLIGRFSLFKFDERNRRAEVGYILDRRYWGKGYMSEVMGCVLDYAFNSFKLHRLEAETDPHNAASLAILKKFGFQREGVFRDRWVVNGKWIDSVILSLLEDDYRAQARNRETES